MKKLNRFLSCLLVFVMLFGVFPWSSMAYAADGEDSSVVFVEDVEVEAATQEASEQEDAPQAEAEANEEAPKASALDEDANVEEAINQAADTDVSGELAADASAPEGGEDHKEEAAAENNNENEDTFEAESASGELIVENAEEASDALSVEALSLLDVEGKKTDVTVTGSLLGTTMKCLDYNVYAYLLSEPGNDAYGVKIEFADGTFTGTIHDVPVGQYVFVLAYHANNQTMTTGKWNRNNVEEGVVVDTTGQYIFGYSAQMPSDKTISAEDHTVSFALQVSDMQSTVNVNTIMDRALNYGIVAEDIKYNVRAYTNFAAKHIDISNSNDSTTYNHRADGVAVVPNILASITHNGQPLSTGDKGANYYVTDNDQAKVSSQNKEETIVKNRNEIEDRVEIMISNTLRQSEALANMSQVTLPSGLTSVDVSPYGENATIILDATNISEEQNGVTIVKRPGQTVIFNINGQNAAPPQNTKIKLVDDNGNQIGEIRKAGVSMNMAPASDGNIWSKIIWNFPDATSVTAANDVGGIFLVPKGDFTASVKGGGWIVARGKVTVTNEWYGFPGSDEPFKQKIIRKTFAGIDENDIDPDYVLKLWTHTNESTTGTTNEQLITTFVLKEENDPSLIYDPSGAADQTGYISKGTDEFGNVVIEWRTPSISVGNEHQLTEENSAGTGGESLDLIEFTAPFSGWSDAASDYVWEQKRSTYGSEEEFFGIFNVSSHNEDYRQYIYVTNNYNIEEGPHDLSLTKKVSDPDQLEADRQSYEFVIELLNGDGSPLTGPVSYRINDGETQTVSLSEGRLTVHLKKDETIKLLQLPFRTRYIIRENNLPDKCTVAFSGNTAGAGEGTGTVTADRFLTATNTYSDGPGRGNLSITKEVKDLTEEHEAAPDQFVFMIKNESGHYVDVYGNESDDPNQYEFRINNGQTVRFNNWPAGAYTVVEKDASSSKDKVSWSLTIGGDASAAGVVTINKGDSAAVLLTNTYEDEPEIGEGNGSLNVSKVVSGLNGNDASIYAEKEYTYTLSITIDGVVKYVQNEKGALGAKPKELKIKAGETRTIENLIYGDYTIVETGIEEDGSAQISGYTLNISYDNEKSSVGQWYSAPKTIRNTYTAISQKEDMTQLTVRKQWYEADQDVTLTTSESSALVRLVRYKTAKTTATVHFYGVNLNDVEVPYNTSVTIRAVNAYMGATSIYQGESPEQWKVQNGQSGYLGGTPYNPANSLMFNSGNHSDIYVYFFNYSGDASVSFEGEASTGDNNAEREALTTQKTLTPDNNWEWTFYNLPLADTQNGINYTYSYAVEEIDPETGYITAYSVNGDPFKTELTAVDAVSSTGANTIIVRNSKTNELAKQYGFKLHKKDYNSNETLNGAVFELKDKGGNILSFDFDETNHTYTYNPDGTVTKITAYTNPLTTVKGLALGTYKLTESNPPLGYARLNDTITINIEAEKDGSGNLTGNAVFSVTGSSYAVIAYETDKTDETECEDRTTVTDDDDTNANGLSVHVEIRNLKGVSMPVTGSNSALLCVLSGFLILTGYGAYTLLSSRRRSRKRL